MRTIAFLPAVTLAAAAPAAAAAAEGRPSLPEWMAGCWVEDSGGRWTEECWMKPRAGMMLGASRSGTGETVREWEALRIEANAAGGDGQTIRMAYRASPNGSGWTTFAWNPEDGPGVTFVNAGHDYPQRIRYWREGPRLIAEIALLDGSKARRWTYDAARP